MWGPGGVSCIIRFICHIPTGMMGISGLSTYTQLAGLGDIYDVIPHGRAFLEGMSFIGYAGAAIFAWNFFQFAASPFCRGNLLGLVGVIDLVLASILIAGVAMAGMFLPDTYGPCNDASNWNNGTDGRNLFLVANATGNFGTSGPNGACQSVMLVWVMTIVVIIFYLICGFINLLLGCLAEPGSKTSFGSMPQYDIDLFTWLLTPARLAFRPLYLLYRLTRGSIHITVRYTSKYLTRKHHRNHLQKYDGSTHDVKPALEPHSLRLPMELVIMITKDLHHADLVNIALSSKYLRTAFFGTNNPVQVARDLRQFACTGGGPLTNCSVCRIQTCPGCRRNAPAPRHNLPLKHLTGCRATCTRCFFTNHCFRSPQPAKPGKTWTTSTGWAGRTFRNRRGTSSGAGLYSSYGGNRMGDRSFGPVLEEVCHNCVRLPEGVREEVRDTGNLREMWRQARLPMTACFTCREVLPEGGVRWWVDSGTGEECKWYGHPGWVDGKGRKVAAGAGI